MDTVVNDLQFIGSDLTFINKLVHSHKKELYWSRSEKYISFLFFCFTFCPYKQAKTLMKILIWIFVLQQCGIAYSTRSNRNTSNAEHKAWSRWSHLSKQISLISSEFLALCVLMLDGVYRMYDIIKSLKT